MTSILSNKEQKLVESSRYTAKEYLKAKKQAEEEEEPPTYILDLAITIGLEIRASDSTLYRETLRKLLDEDLGEMSLKELESKAVQEAQKTNY